MTNYPDNMNHRELDEQELDPAVEEAHTAISELSAKLSEGVDALLAALRPHGLASMNEEPEELFDMLSEKYDYQFAEHIKILEDHEVAKPTEFLFYQGIHRRKPVEVDFLLGLRPVPTNPATPGFGGGDNE